jgi:N6-adenosine-specific RNA methylase IME4
MTLSPIKPSQNNNTHNSEYLKQIPLFRLKTTIQKPLFRKVPETFDVIYADPPWDYDQRTFLNKKANNTGSASDHYPTMTLQQLCCMNVRKLRAKNSIMYMWTTGPQLQASIQLMIAWGYTYKTVAFVWDKIRLNPGYYSMSQTEFVIVGTHGAIPKPRGRRNVRQFLQSKRTRHSQKPHEIRRRIEIMHPEQTKLEMFARDTSSGWFSHGNQCQGSVQLPL